MEIVNRKRGSGQGRTSVFSDKKVKYNFDLHVLDLMCSYIISKNRNIKKSHIINMRNLFDSIDLDIYQNDIEKMKRIRFIRRGIDARLVEDLNNPTLILVYINGGIVNGEIEQDSLPELSNSELQFINETVTGALACTFIDTEMDLFYDLYVKYKAQDYRYRDKMNAEIEQFIKDWNNKFRKNKSESMSNRVFSLDEGVFENQVSDIYDTLTSPSRFLLTGMQGFNMISGGGLESTRLYLLLGMAGVGKSMVLLNLALQLKKYNRGYLTKDPTKIPTILYLTQENTVDETVDRIANIITGKNMASFSKKDIINILKQDGELMLSGDNNINIHIVYRPDRSIDTGDLYTIIEDLEDDGYEVIALLQDHIKRIRSSYNYNGDLRLELGAVVNEMKILAQLKEIPIVTVSHLNREASRTIDSSVQGNKTDLTRLLGRSNVGESMLMVDNSDCVIIVNREYDQEGNGFMVFKQIKIRSAGTPRDYICQPFEIGSGTKMVEDLYEMVPLFKDSLVPQSQVNGNPMTLNGMTLKSSSYTNIKSLDTDEEDNLFGSFMQYNNKDFSSESKISLNSTSGGINIQPQTTPSIVIPTITAHHSGDCIPLVIFEDEYV